ncbi:C25 family cysteine peptidase [Anaerosporobacter faecicola]|uniref:C25 family cysteine peptidase n=1 Tax=Anaerosporobacter faecicola TaxID=2718714 RepID=UPI00143C7531|nr:C25 family cysteine peptidase [Anaerosporobacter faecicola]
MKVLKQNGAKRFLASLLVIILAVSLMPNLSTKPNNVVAANKSAYEDVTEIELNYYFGDLQFGEGEHGKTVDIDGLTKVNDEGMPNLPSKSISVLIPSGKQVAGVRIETSDEERYENILVEPASAIVSSIEENNEDVTASYDESVYKKGEIYPKSNYGEGSTSSTRGYQVYSMLLYPVQYQEQCITFTKHMKVVLKLAEEEAQASVQAKKGSAVFVPTKEDESFISDKVENIEVAASYYEKADETITYSALLGSDPCDYVIITSDELKTAFEPLANNKIARGLRAKIVTTSEIYASYVGRDQAEQIRNFIKDAYACNHIKYVLLGGDADGDTPIVPTRILYCAPVTTDTTTSLASDLYFGCLDGDFDSNANNTFGETSDNVDFTYDVLVGRAPVDDVTEATNFVTKTIAYESREQNAKVTLVGEVLQSNSDGCTSELAAELQTTMDAGTLTDNLRLVRDQIVDDTYVSLYYDANSFLKTVFVNDMSLLLDFSELLVSYHKDFAQLVSTGACSDQITKSDIKKIQAFCTDLKEAMKDTSATYAKKDKLIEEVEYAIDYVGMAEGKTFDEIILSSKFADSSKTSSTVSYNTVDGEDDEENYIFGGDYMDEIKDGATSKNGGNDFVTVGFPDNYNKNTLYDRDYKDYNWPKSEVISIMNSSPEVVNHLGHCNNTTLMKCSVEDMESLTNQQAFFVYSQGCYAGAFDGMDTSDNYTQPDCVAEQLVVSNSVSGAYACIVNSRYGWYSRVGTDGPSQAYNRKFWDAVFTSSETSRNIGSMLAQSKEYFIKYLSGYDSSTAMLFCYYEQNLLGDPEASLYTIANKVEVPATSVVVNLGKNVTLEKGKSLKATAFLYPKNNTDTVYWKTSNRKIATVSEDGTIKAKKKGTVKITAKALGGKTYVTTVKVIDAQKSSKATKSVTLSQTTATCLRGDKVTLTATIKGSKTGLLWYSSDINVATVTSKGVVDVVGAGECIIYCRTANGKQAKCTITATLPPIVEETPNP